MPEVALPAKNTEPTVGENTTSLMTTTAVPSIDEVDGDILPPIAETVKKYPVHVQSPTATKRVYAGSQHTDLSVRETNDIGLAIIHVAFPGHHQHAAA